MIQPLRLAGTALRRVGNQRATFISRGQRTYASDSTANAKPLLSHGVVGGLAGGGLAFASFYAWYHFSGAKTAVQYSKSTAQYFNQAKQKLQDASPDPNDALGWLKSTAQSYTSFIPGARYYVDKAFEDLDAIHEKHADEVDAIVSDTYHKLKKLTQEKGASTETMSDAMAVLGEAVNKIMDLTSDAAEQILNNHPELKQRLGSDVDQLKKMGEKYGPEAKEQVRQTWKQMQDVLSKGFSASTIAEIQKIIAEKSEKIKKSGDELFERGFEQVKPLLEKSPRVKQIVEENKEALKNGNISELVAKVREAMSSGKTEELENYVKSAANKAKQGASSSSSGSSSASWSALIPGGDEIFSKVSRLQDIGKKHGHEAEELLSKTISEIQDILKKRVDDAEKLADRAAKDSKA